MSLNKRLINTGAGGAVAIENDGQLVLTGSTSNSLNRSDNYGQSFYNYTPIGFEGITGYAPVKQIAISGTGQYIGCLTSSGFFHSSDFGVSFVQRNTTAYPNLVYNLRISDDGTKIIYADYYSSVWYSTNSGVSFSQTFVAATGGPTEYASVSASNDGQKVLYCANWGTKGAYISNDYGATFTKYPYNDGVVAGDVTSDGLKILAILNPQFISYNGATTWSAESITTGAIISGLALSGDSSNTRILQVNSDGIWTSGSVNSLNLTQRTFSWSPQTFNTTFICRQSYSGQYMFLKNYVSDIWVSNDYGVTFNIIPNNSGGLGMDTNRMIS